MFKLLKMTALILLMAATSATALDIGGVTVPDTIDSGNGKLILNGSGIRKKFGLKIYVGSLYLKSKTGDSQQIIDADEPMVITMHWKRNGPKDKINGVWDEGFTYALGAESLKNDIEKLKETTVDGKKNDVWKYEYIPGKGVTSSVNGQVTATYTDFNFKKALFSVWLYEGEKFVGDKKLRDGMLGK